MKHQSRPQTHRAGFTLMELLVVISIIVILSGLTVGGFAFVNQRQAKSQAKIQIGLLQLALEDYKSDNGEYPIGRSSTGTGQTGNIYEALFPSNSNEKVYLAELDPKNDSQGWLGGQTSGTQLTIYDPWGTEYYYRCNDPARPTRSYSANPDFDLWSAGPDGKTNAGSRGSYDPEHPDNLDDIRGW